MCEKAQVNIERVAKLLRSGRIGVCDGREYSGVKDGFSTYRLLCGMLYGESQKILSLKPHGIILWVGILQ